MAHVTVLILSSTTTDRCTVLEHLLQETKGCWEYAVRAWAREQLTKYLLPMNHASRLPSCRI
jgi:hypothetical protein